MSSAAISSAENRAMSSVFIGNIHYDMTEDQLKSLFSEIGPILNFRLFGDKIPGNAKVAFCEYKDPELAIRATRSFTGYEFKGLPLRVDVATSEKCRHDLERLGSIMDSLGDGSDSSTDKAPEEISKAVASLPAEQMFELMKQMKMCIENNPQEARNLLLQNPQLAYALLQAQVIMRIVDPKVAVKILNRPIVPAGVSDSKVNEQVPTAGPVNESPSTFPAGVTSDSIPLNPPPSLSASGLNLPLRPPMMSVPPVVPGIPNQFADQDLRTMSDQDLRQLPMLGDRDMRAPPLMMGGDKDMRQPMGDQDFRTLGIPPAVPENRPFDPRFRSMQGPDRAPMPSFERSRPVNLDPRTGYEVRNVGGPARVEDPRKASMSAALNSRLSAAGPALQSLGPNMMNIGGPHSAMGSPGMPDEQEKAALIMQVLQLTDQQIAMLPPEQRQSILVLKEQLARSQIT